MKIYKKHISLNEFLKLDNPAKNNYQITSKNIFKCPAIRGGWYGYDYIYKVHKKYSKNDFYLICLQDNAKIEFIQTNDINFIKSIINKVEKWNENFYFSC